MNDNKEVKAAIDRLAVQIPGNVRDLRLESPEIEFHFTYQRANWDRDNAVTTLLDILVQYGVLKDDNLKRCNGPMHIWPAQQGDYDAVKIVLIPREEEHIGAPRYINPKRTRLRQAIMPPCPTRDIPDFLEPIPPSQESDLWDDLFQD